MKPPYPTEIPPLLPLFLNKRRAKMTFPLQKTEELGLDRATFIWTINLSYRGARGASAEPGDLASVYGTIPGRWLPMAAAARGAGLAEERDGRWYLTEKGRGLAAAMHEAARAYYATLTPLPKGDLAELARLLDKAFQAAAKASEPATRLHTPFALGYRGDETASGIVRAARRRGLRALAGARRLPYSGMAFRRPLRTGGRGAHEAVARGSGGRRRTQRTFSRTSGPRT